MSPDSSPAERAERLQRRRNRNMTVQGLIFILWQATFFAAPHADLTALRTVDQVRISGFIVWALVLLALIATGGGWWDSREMKALMQDESTIAHRRSAIMAGYWAAMMGAIGLYMLTLFTEVRLVEAIHIILSLGIAGPLLRFAQLERRAARD